jgi:3-dehydroquinate dehydratase I
MTLRRQPKRSLTAIVGVIASNDELRLARRMRKPPDLFELRLDYLRDLREREMARFKHPLIMTARHPAEGGAGNLSDGRRRELLLRFLPRAAFVDIELRSVPALKEIWDEAGRQKIRRICSVHDFDATPPLVRLRKQFNCAKKSGADVFKVVSRAESIDDLVVLLELLRSQTEGGRLCVMATGKFGAVSRLLFPECGSAFVYAPIRHCLHDGQLTLQQLRRLRDFYPKT